MITNNLPPDREEPSNKGRRSNNNSTQRREGNIIKDNNTGKPNKADYISSRHHHQVAMWLLYGLRWVQMG